MPITAQAIKKSHTDKKRAARNYILRKTYRSAIKTMRQKPTAKNLSLAYKTLDKAAKTNVIHSNKAARLKTRITKLLKK